MDKYELIEELNNWIAGRKADIAADMEGYEWQLPQGDDAIESLDEALEHLQRIYDLVEKTDHLELPMQLPARR